MKKAEVQECLRLYRKGVDAYGELTEKLKAVRAAAEGFSVLPRTRRHLEEAVGDLDRIGEGLSVLPELAGRLLEVMRIYGLLKRQAVQAGLTVRYDLDGEEDEGFPGGADR